MIRFPAITAFILIATALTGCQAISPATQTPAGKDNNVITPTPPVTQTEEQDSERPVDTPAKPPETTTPVAKPVPEVTVTQMFVQLPKHVDGKLVLGFSEKGRLPDLGVSMPAKIDTGATRTSMDARDITFFERDGNRWVRFSLHRTSEGIRKLELPLKDTIAIKRPGEESQRRPVVSLTVQVGDITQLLDVSLNDRNNYEFPMLIGRDFLQDLAVADVGKREIAVEKPLKTISRKIPEDKLEAIDKTVYQAVSVSNLVTFGAMEHVRLNGIDTPLKARIDTGAVTSSLDARDLENFKKNGREWVRFNLYSEKQPVNIELPISRYVYIKRHGELPSQRRPVVEMQVQVGRIKKNAEFTLRDRSSYEFPVLIAESFLANTALVDVSQEYIAEKSPRGNE